MYFVENKECVFCLCGFGGPGNPTRLLVFCVLFCAWLVFGRLTGVAEPDSPTRLHGRRLFALETCRNRAKTHMCLLDR